MKYYLKTNTEAEMIAALSCLEIDGIIPTDTEDYSLFVIGKLEKPPVYGVIGEQTVETFPDSYVDPETDELILGEPVAIVTDVTGVISPAESLPGFHANYIQLQGEIPPELLAISLDPAPNKVLVDRI